MALSVSEILAMPGYEDVTDHVTIEYLRDTQYSGAGRLGRPPHVDGMSEAGKVYFYSPASAAEVEPLQVHGRPVPGDRDFRSLKQHVDNHREGISPLFLKEECAPERLDEMRKMLRLMMTTHDRNFGPPGGSQRLKQEGEVLGLEDEHKQYVENLGMEWRAVGKLLRSKRSQKSEDSVDCSASDVSSHLELQSCQSSESVEVNATGNSSKDHVLSRSNSLESLKTKGKFLSQSTAHGDEENDSNEFMDGKGNQDSESVENMTDDSNSSDVGSEVRRISDGTVNLHEASGEAESSNAHESREVVGESTHNEVTSPILEKLDHGCGSTSGDGTSLASSEVPSDRNLGDLDQHENCDPEVFPKGSRRPQALVVPKDTENPVEHSSQLFMRDRRSSDPDSPFKDRSNADQKRTQRRLPDEGRHSKPPWMSGSKTPEKSPKRLPSFDFRRRLDLRGHQNITGSSEDLADLSTVSKPKFVRSATVDPRITLRNKSGNEDFRGFAEPFRSEKSSLVPEVPISTPALSPIRVDDHDKNCTSSEPAHRSCSVCSARRAANGEERSPLNKSGSRSPYSPYQNKKGRNIFGTTDVQNTQTTVKKGSGIYTPLSGSKKPNIVFKANSSRLSSSVDVADNDKTYLRQSSLRSSREGSTSAGVQIASGEVKSEPVESHIFTRSSTTWSERTQSHREKLTPGGPRRGGKVDRVARFAEMQNLWKSDKFLNASGKRKSQSFYRMFSELHESHERFYAAYRERCGTVDPSKEMVERLLTNLVATDSARSKNDPPPFASLRSSSERVRSPRPFL